jgi:Fe2+ or Zn2+ uptake regulation protein
MLELDPMARERMSTAGHVYTRGRQLVLQTLAELAAPATIPAILAAAPALVQSSLYRNLAVLEEAGLVTRVDVGDERAYFELSELVTQDHHHHLVCRSCSTVVDVTLPTRAEQSLERVFSAAATEAGFELEDHRVDLVGLCADCAA